MAEFWPGLTPEREPTLAEHLQRIADSGVIGHHDFARLEQAAAIVRAWEAAPVVTFNELRRDCRDELHIVASGDNLSAVTGLLFERVRLVPAPPTERRE